MDSLRMKSTHSRFGDWLLCDFHIHTTFSDGELSLEEVVDLYGQKGFDVISTTDHIADRATLAEMAEQEERIQTVQKEDYDSYL